MELVYEIEEDVPGFVVGDPGRLRQVILNLTGNAIKFTAQGEVALRVAILENSATGVVLQFSVRDTGIGIAPEKQRFRIRSLYAGGRIDRAALRWYWVGAFHFETAGGR